MSGVEGARRRTSLNACSKGGKLCSGRLVIANAGLLSFFILPASVGVPAPPFPTQEDIVSTVSGGFLLCVKSFARMLAAPNGSTSAVDSAVSTAEEDAADETGAPTSAVSTTGDEVATNGTGSRNSAVSTTGEGKAKVGTAAGAT